MILIMLTTNKNVNV